MSLLDAPIWRNLPRIAQGDGDLGAHDLLRADVVALEVVGDALQARGVEAGPLRLGVHKNPPEEMAVVPIGGHHERASVRNPRKTNGGRA